PGNVVVDLQERVFLLDFDRACVYPGLKNKLRDRYLARWERAVQRHGLPPMLSGLMRAGLNRDYEC
ncbi:MAG: hypothetical protein JSW39_20900, partial [Desulfobacterales bacterium]